MSKVKQDTKCCDNQRIMVDEEFSYECEFEDGKLLIYTNDYDTEGFNNYRCVNCDKQFSVEETEIVW